MGKKKNKSNSEVNLIASVLRLQQKNVPALMIWQHQGELKKFGTGQMSKWYDDLDLVTKQSLSSCMVTDMKNLSTGSEEEELLMNDENISYKVRASAIYSSLVKKPSGEGLPRLPFPLSLMSKKQKVQYICNRIAAEAKVMDVKVVYGCDGWKPSFWLEHIWSWSSVKRTLNKMNVEEFTGDGSFLEFLSLTVKAILDAEKLDPENYVENIINKEKTLKKKKRARGIHVEPSVVKVQDKENNQPKVTSQFVAPSEFQSGYHSQVFDGNENQGFSQSETGNKVCGEADYLRLGGYPDQSLAGYQAQDDYQSPAGYHGQASYVGAAGYQGSANYQVPAEYRVPPGDYLVPSGYQGPSSYQAPLGLFIKMIFQK